MDDFVLNFKKAQAFIERLKERVETALNEKDEEIGQMRDEVKRLDSELKRWRRENDALREELRKREKKGNAIDINGEQQQGAES